METMSMKEIVKEITVDIDQLAPLEKDNKDQDSGVEKDPLKRLASTTMQRLPSMCFDSAVKDWMRFSIEQLLQNMACSTAVDMEAKVEVINVSGSSEKGHMIPYVQARAKVDIPQGTLRLFPHRRYIVVDLGFQPTRESSCWAKGLVAELHERLDGDSNCIATTAKVRPAVLRLFAYGQKRSCDAGCRRHSNVEPCRPFLGGHAHRPRRQSSS
jgi:hypothetical protein